MLAWPRKSLFASSSPTPLHFCSATPRPVPCADGVFLSYRPSVSSPHHTSGIPWPPKGSRPGLAQASRHCYRGLFRSDDVFGGKRVRQFRFRAEPRQLERQHVFGVDLDVLLLHRLHELILAPPGGESLHADAVACHARVREPGWYEVLDDPWSVRWWSGNEWTGQPVPFTASMLTARAVPVPGEGKRLARGVRRSCWSR